jgi:hypothetical protein
MFVSENTFFNDQIKFLLNPVLIDPRRIPEYQVSQSLLVGTEFEFDIGRIANIGQIYTDTIFTAVTSSQNYELVVTTPIANRVVMEQLIDKTFKELDIQSSTLNIEDILSE